MIANRLGTAVAACALIALCASLAVWGSALAGPVNGPLQTSLAVLSLLALAACASAAAVRGRRAWRAASRHLRALAELDPRDIHCDAAIARLPPLPPGHPLLGASQLLVRSLRTHLERLKDAEHDRTALEIRCRRAQAQCEQIKGILSGLSDPILAIDDYEEVVLANPRAETLFGADAMASEDRALAQLVRCQKLVDLLSGIAHRKSAGSRTEEIELIDSAGQAHCFRATATKLAAGFRDDSEGAGPSGAVAVLRDIGDQKALQRRNAEFVSAVSHEMKTPLAGIKAYVELLEDGDAEDEETREEFLQVISGQADRLQRLVENLLNLARIEAGVVNVNKQNRSLNEILEEALRVVQPSAEAKQIKLASDLSPLYLGVLADRDMLLQGAINLLSNAIKYTHPGGRVTLRSRAVDDARVRFEVEDTGVGLSEEDCQRVFEKFYRVRKDQDMAAGTGLGLPLARHIVEDVHGGSMRVSSVQGQGSTFSVELPNAGQMT